MIKLNLSNIKRIDNRNYVAIRELWAGCGLAKWIERKENEQLFEISAYDETTFEFSR